MNEVINAVTYFQFMTQELIKYKFERFKCYDRLLSAGTIANPPRSLTKQSALHIHSLFVALLIEKIGYTLQTWLISAHEPSGKPAMIALPCAPGCSMLPVSI